MPLLEHFNVTRWLNTTTNAHATPAFAGASGLLSNLAAVEHRILSSEAQFHYAATFFSFPAASSFKAGIRSLPFMNTLVMLKGIFMW